MGEARMHIELRCRLAWWFPVYLNTLVFFCLTFGGVPDWQKVERCIERALRFEIRIGGRWRRVDTRFVFPSAPPRPRPWLR